MNQVDPIKAFVLTLLTVLTLPLSCLTMLASSGCSAQSQKDTLAYAMETRGELDANAATDGEIGFFFGTKFGIKLPVTATAHVKNNPYAMPAKKEEPIKLPVTP